MAFDRNKYKPSKVVDLKDKEEEVSNKTASNGVNFNNFLKIKKGVNKIRIFPAHEGTVKNLYTQAKTTSWLPQEVESEDKDGKKTTEIKRKPIFNSRIHGGTRKDLVEEYATFIINQMKEKYEDDKKGLEKAIKPIIHWKTGIRPGTSWVVYAKKVLSDGSAEYGRLEMTNGTKEKLNVIAATEDEDEAIMTDPFTHPDDGKMIRINYDPDVEGAKMYTASLLYKTDAPLTDEELKDFEKATSLEDIYVNSFKREHFELQLSGLEIFDNEHGFGAFTHDDWLDICDEIDKYYPENEDDQDEEGDQTDEDVEDETEQEDKTSDDQEDGEDEEPFEKDEEEEPKADAKPSAKEKAPAKKGSSRMSAMKAKYKKKAVKTES